MRQDPLRFCLRFFYQSPLLAVIHDEPVDNIRKQNVTVKITGLGLSGHCSDLTLVEWEQTCRRVKFLVG